MTVVDRFTPRADLTPTLLVRHVGWIYESADSPGPIVDGYIAAAGSRLIGVGAEPCPWANADVEIDGSGLLAIPGLVNSHHHFFQHLTRAVPATQNATLLDWLTELYPLWASIDRDAYRLAAEAAIAELLLSGCTTTVNMAYLNPDGQEDLVAEDIAAAGDLGIRIHEVRGSISVLEADTRGRLGRRVSARLIEDRAEVLAASERAVGLFHDSSEFSMVRVGVGPTTIDLDDPSFMVQLARMGRQAGGCHTHMRPRPDEDRVARERYGMTPLEYLDSVGWLTGATWIAHAARCSADDFAEFTRHGTGVVHCPRMLARLGAPVPPVVQASRAGTNMGLGVDGAASNDSGSMIGELRSALLLHRLPGIQPDLAPSSWPTAREILGWATTGGALLLGRPDIGALSEGKAADIAFFDTRRIAFAGALRDPLGGLLFAGDGPTVHTTVVNGRVAVRDGRLVNRNEAELAADLNAAALRLTSSGQHRRRHLASHPPRRVVGSSSEPAATGRARPHDR